MNGRTTKRPKHGRFSRGVPVTFTCATWATASVKRAAGIDFGVFCPNTPKGILQIWSSRSSEKSELDRLHPANSLRILARKATGVRYFVPMTNSASDYGGIVRLPLPRYCWNIPLRRFGQKTPPSVAGIDLLCRLLTIL